MKKLICIFMMFGMLAFFGCSSGGGSDDLDAVANTNERGLMVEAGSDRIILAGMTLKIDLQDYYSPDSDVSFEWDFGDGETATGKSAIHTYANTGQYNSKVTVTTSSGKSAFDTFVIKVVTWETIETPVDAQGHAITNPLASFLLDGRMVIAEGVDNKDIEIAVETSKASKIFDYVMSIKPEGEFSYPCFIKAYGTDGVIIGASDVIYTVDLAAKRADLLAAVYNYDGALFGNNLYVTRYGYVSQIDLSNKNVTDVVTDISGYSGGICLDSKGDIYTGIGSSVDETGHIRKFIKDSLPVKWSNGTLFADALTADSLIYNESGIILVGGGDIFGTSGDYNYFCALDAEIGRLLFKLDPDPSAMSSYKLAEGGGMFAASVWDWGQSKGVIYTLPFEALGLEN